MESDEEKPLTAKTTTDKQVDYNAVFGATTQDKNKITTTVFGKINNIRDCRRYIVEWIFLGLSLLAFLGTLGITIERLVNFDEANGTNESQSIENRSDCETWTCTSDYTFTIVLIINIVFCLFYAIDGVLRERLFEILAVAVAVVVVLIYLIGNFILRPDEHTPLRIARLVLTAIFGPILIVFALFVCYRMGKLQFVLVGANRTLMRAYQIRSFLATVLFFNLEVMASVSALAFVRNQTLIDLPEVVFISLIIVYVFIVTVVGWTAIWYEIKWVTIVYFVLFTPVVIYPFYKIVDVSIHFEEYYKTEDGNGALYNYIGICLLIACLIWIVICILSQVLTVLTYREYGKGLLEKVPPPPVPPILLDLYSRCMSMKKSAHIQ